MFITLQFCSLEVWYRSSWASVMVKTELVPFRGSEYLLPRFFYLLESTCSPGLRSPFLCLPNLLFSSSHHSLLTSAALLIGRRQWHPTPVLLPEKILRTEEPGRLQSMGLWRVGHDWATSLSRFTSVHWRRQWQPTPVFLPGESQGWGSLVDCRLWGCTESDMTEVT